MDDKKILVGMPNVSGILPTSVAVSLLMLSKPGDMDIRVVHRNRTDVSRNMILQTAIDNGHDYVLFIDDDGVIPVDALEMLLEDDKDIVMGTMMKRDGTDIACLERIEVETEEGKTAFHYEFIKGFDSKDGHLVQIDGGGMACTLVKRKVFEVLYTQYNGKPFMSRYEELGNGMDRVMGDDVLFCERAKEAGFEVWCDLRVRPGHLGDQKVYYFNDNLIN